MARQRLHRSLLVGAVALAVALVPVASCLAASVQPSESHQLACCAGMTQGCGDSMTTQNDCCAVQSTDVVRLGSASQSGRPLVLVTSTIVTEPASPAVVTPAAFGSGIPKPSSSPTYLLVSVFRL